MQPEDTGALCAKPEAVNVAAMMLQIKAQDRTIQALRERNAELERSRNIARHEWEAAQDKLAEIERNLIRITGIETDYATNIDTLTEQRDTALSELAACRKDTERLDWFEENVCDVADICGNPDAETPLFMVTLLTHDSYTPYRGETLREAIDAARNKDAARRCYP